MSKRVLSSILLIFLISWSAPCFAGFLVKLKNNRTLDVQSYRFEGDQIILYLENAFIKLSREDVDFIVEKAPDPPGPEQEVKQEPLVDRVEGKGNVEFYKKKKKETQLRLEEAKKAYFEAVSKPDKEIARQKMLSVSKELFELQQEVVRENNGVLPRWWEEE